MLKNRRQLRRKKGRNYVRQTCDEQYGIFIYEVIKTAILEILENMIGSEYSHNRSWNEILAKKDEIQWKLWRKLMSKSPQEKHKSLQSRKFQSLFLSHFYDIFSSQSDFTRQYNREMNKEISVNWLLLWKQGLRMAE